MQVSALTIAERYGQAEWCCVGATIVLGDLENVGVGFGIAPLVVAV